MCIELPTVRFSPSIGRLSSSSQRSRASRDAAPPSAKSPFAMYARQDVVQGERDLFALAQLAGDREGGFARLDGSGCVPSAVDVGHDDVPQRPRLGGSVPMPARHEHVLLREPAPERRVELRCCGRVQQRDGRVRRKLHGVVLSATASALHLLVVRDRVVVAADQLQRAASALVHRPEERRGRADAARGLQSHAVVRLRFGVRVEARRGVAGHRRVREGRSVLARLREMEDELRRDLLEMVPRRLLEDLRDPPVRGPAVLREERAVRRLLRERVAERELGL